MITLLAERAGPQTAVVRVGRALDFRTAADFRGLCRKMHEEGVNQFVLDFSRTGILDSTGLGAIYSVYREVSADGGHIAFASVSRSVQHVVQTTGTYKVFRQFATVNEATGTQA